MQEFKTSNFVHHMSWNLIQRMFVFCMQCARFSLCERSTRWKTRLSFIRKHKYLNEIWFYRVISHLIQLHMWFPSVVTTPFHTACTPMLHTFGIIKWPRICTLSNTNSDINVYTFATIFFSILGEMTENQSTTSSISSRCDCLWLWVCVFIYFAWNGFVPALGFTFRRYCVGKYLCTKK